MKCKRCHESNTIVKVIYAGIPARLCITENCFNLTGIGAHLIALLPFNGQFFIYTGNYFIGLIEWWRATND